MRFGIVGAANFVLTFLVFYGMLRLAMAHHLVALAASWVAGTLFSYVFNFIWVFKPEDALMFRRFFARFLAASVLSVLLNMLALDLLVSRTGYDPLYIQFALIPFIVGFNFMTAKFWSLKPDAARD